jgi:hypothetical protein
MGFKRFGKNGKRTTATFGRTTERYVRELQGRLGHAPDGVVTEDLWRELMHERLHQAVAPPPRSVDDVPTEIEGIPFAEPRGQVWPVCCSVDEGRHVAFQGERELHDLEHAPGRWFWCPPLERTHARGGRPLRRRGGPHPGDAAGGHHRAAALLSRDPRPLRVG